jgi:hypothetical protein
MKKLILGAALAVAAAAAAPNIIWGDAANAAAPAPIVTTLTPAHGPAAGGNTVVVTGSDLNDNGTPVIKFGANTGTGVLCVPAPAASCQVTVPGVLVTGSVPVTVTDGASGTSNATIDYTYLAANNVQIVSKWSGKAVDLRGSSPANGTPVQQYTVNGTGAQKWTVAAGFTLRTQNGKCMDVTGRSTANGAKIQEWSCNGGANQRWLFRPNGEIVNPVSGRCLDDTDFSTVNGKQLQIWGCNGTLNQLWTRTAV